MTTSITSSPTLGGSQYSEVLYVAKTYGAKFGSPEAGTYSDILDVYIRHNSVQNIYNLKVYLKAFSQSYGGQYSAALDFTKAIQQGDSDSGFQIDFDYDTANPFTTFSIMNSAQGSSIANAIDVPITAFFKNNLPTTNPDRLAPTGAVKGSLGEFGNTVLGDTALLRCRWGALASEIAPGRRQIDLAYIYNFFT